MLELSRLRPQQCVSVDSSDTPSNASSISLENNSIPAAGPGDATTAERIPRWISVRTPEKEGSRDIMEEIRCVNHDPHLHSMLALTPFHSVLTQRGPTTRTVNRSPQ